MTIQEDVDAIDHGSKHGKGIANENFGHPIEANSNTQNKTKLKRMIGN